MAENSASTLKGVKSSATCSGITTCQVNEVSSNLQPAALQAALCMRCQVLLNDGREQRQHPQGSQVFCNLQHKPIVRMRFQVICNLPHNKLSCASWGQIISILHHHKHSCTCNGKSSTTCCTTVNPMTEMSSCLQPVALASVL